MTNSVQSPGLHPGSEDCLVGVYLTVNYGSSDRDLEAFCKQELRFEFIRVYSIKDEASILR